ncbi:MAG TPA: hypothetical protein VKZ49_03725 [Polyangiaceae bacterium]|nr:hypothetical protein [Polyangiaceae bacterium]
MGSDAADRPPKLGAPPDPRRVGVFSAGIARLPHLKTFVGCEELVRDPADDQARSLDAVIGWGHKPTAQVAREYAQRHGLPYLALEDGFLRSVGLGRDDPPLSLIVDDVGVYYDAREPSRLERLLAFDGQDDPLADPALLERARRCRARIVDAKLSKYNHTPVSLPPELSPDRGPFVLVADQTLDDASVSQGLCSADDFDQMLEAARRTHAGARIVVKVHPDTVAGIKAGYLAERALPDGVEVVRAAVNPLLLLQGAAHVYVCTSQLGFEALLLEKPVTCFGAPFYSGWGLTEDSKTVAGRGRRRSLDELVAAALLLYPRYVHPVRAERCAAEEIIAHLALQRQVFAQNSRRFFCFGFSAWKRPFVRRYLAAPGNEVRFVRSPEHALRRGFDRGATVVSWASKSTPELLRWAREVGSPVWNMEDGFLRSVRLGSDLTAPGSLVLDQRGIYYDPRQPSDLESLLQNCQFTPEEIERAAALRQAIVAAGISKYNPVARSPLELQKKPGQRAVLVVGQVEDDASVRFGSPVIKTNLALLRVARASCPGAHLVYKPHPDVLSGNRRAQVLDEQRGLWDELVEQAPIDQCLGAVDEVHTMTSLVGFEALLRGLRVVTYGQPFYSGWGLTLDRCPLDRRTRRLSLDELVAGALVAYPRYYSWQARAFCTPEDMVFELSAGRALGEKRPYAVPGVLRKLRGLALSAWEWTREL